MSKNRVGTEGGDEGREQTRLIEGDNLVEGENPFESVLASFRRTLEDKPVTRDFTTTVSR